MVVNKSVAPNRQKLKTIHKTEIENHTQKENNIELVNNEKRKRRETKGKRKERLAVQSAAVLYFV